MAFKKGRFFLFSQLIVFIKSIVNIWLLKYWFVLTLELEAIIILRLCCFHLVPKFEKVLHGLIFVVIDQWFLFYLKLPRIKSFVTEHRHFPVPCSWLIGVSGRGFDVGFPRKNGFLALYGAVFGFMVVDISIGDAVASVTVVLITHIVREVI